MDSKLPNIQLFTQDISRQTGSNLIQINTAYCGGAKDVPCANLGDELGPMLLLKLSGSNIIEKCYDGLDVVVIGSVISFMVSQVNDWT
jgi:hypothetical protein